MMESFREEGFDELPRVMAPSAVYVLLWEGRVVYVGQSKNVYARVATHYQAVVRARKGLRQAANYTGPAAFRFDKVMIRWCPKRDLDRLETELIDRFRPEHNVIVRRVLPKLSFDVLGLADELGFGWKKLETEPARMRRRRVTYPNRATAKVTLPKLKFLEEESA